MCIYFPFGDDDENVVAYSFLLTIGIIESSKRDFLSTFLSDDDDEIFLSFRLWFYLRKVLDKSSN